MKTKQSRTYIINKGRKIYLLNTYWDVRDKLRNKNEEISLTVTGLFSDKEKLFNTNNISEYGRI